ncbi:MAG: sigma-54 dependent transcriptional regulator [Acidobacteria bacterium]|jgi:DNA-binding NtrC family response regulator|nr:sigma-54 dependent transcriptional regulator [Acidobacteriota bacterium]
MDKKFGKILVIDDDEDVLQAARLFLKLHMELVYTEKDPQKIPTLIKNISYDVILLDMNFSRDVTGGQEGFYWLNKILAVDPTAVVILITAFGDVDMAVRAIKEGATDFILKPWQNEKLLATLSAALNLRRSRLELTNLKSRQTQLIADLNQPREFIGISPGMQKVFATIQKVSNTDANVLVLGENGTGKELVARALHHHSNRCDEVFISVDMAAVSETLFESELFGYTKGSFTDAKNDRIGRFEIAAGGTLFLDEIGNLPISLQAKILSVLETRQVIPIGSNKPRTIDIRLICATNMPIYDMVKKKEFRQDLLYRINTVEIHIPPLRERIEDIPLLTDYFISIYSHKYKKPVKTISPTALKKMTSYHWPGNVRELQHAVERSVILSDSQVLQPEDFFFTNLEIASEKFLFDNYNLEEVEKTVIGKVIEKYKGNVSQAAHELGLTRTSLYRRMEKYGL